MTEYIFVSALINEWKSDIIPEIKVLTDASR